MAFRYMKKLRRKTWTGGFIRNNKLRWFVITQNIMSISYHRKIISIFNEQQALLENERKWRRRRIRERESPRKLLPNSRTVRNWGQDWASIDWVLRVKTSSQQEMIITRKNFYSVLYVFIKLLLRYLSLFKLSGLPAIWTWIILHYWVLSFIHNRTQCWLQSI